MRYMLFICTDPEAEPYSREEDHIEQWVRETEGVRLHGDRLRPVSDAVTVRVRAGRTLTTEGPFAETQEHVAGYDVIECDTLEQAVEVASRHPMARFGRVEVRPFWPFDDEE